MAKNYEKVAMDVIREDWEFRKTQHNASFNQERIARMMGISRSQFAKALGENKNPTISFICHYATAVGRPIDELLHTIGLYSILEEETDIRLWDIYRKMYRAGKVQKDTIAYAYENRITQKQLNQMNELLSKHYDVLIYKNSCNNQ